MLSIVLLFTYQLGIGREIRSNGTIVVYTINKTIRKKEEEECLDERK